MRTNSASSVAHAARDHIRQRRAVVPIPVDRKNPRVPARRPKPLGTIFALQGMMKSFILTAVTLPLARHQHQRMRTEDGGDCGDKMKYHNFRIMGDLARDNAEALRELPGAAAPPADVKLTGGCRNENE